MAIYIKGMDMPTNCTDCCYRPLVGCNPYQDNGLSPSDHRHSTCPLTEVAEPSGDLISRADAIEAVCSSVMNAFDVPPTKGYDVVEDALSALPSTEAEPTVIRSRTFMPTKDFKEWAKRIREVNPNVMVIPVDAEVASAEAVQGWIPCSERLPERGVGLHYLVTLKDGHIFRDDVYEAFFDKNGWHMDCNELAYDDVIAWMPLPKPYREEKQNG